MRQEEIEKFAFLYLCGKNDRKLLKGKAKMTFGDFERLAYLTQTLGLSFYNIEFWNQYGKEFKKPFKNLGRFLEDKQETRAIELLEEDLEQVRIWVAAFYMEAPNKESKAYIYQQLGAIIEE